MHDWEIKYGRQYLRQIGCLATGSFPANCRGVPEQRTSPQLPPKGWLLPSMVDTAVGV